MKIPRFLKTIMALLVVIAFIRVVNGAGAISISDYLVQLQDFDFDVTAVTDMVDAFRGRTFLDEFVPWNDNLTGVGGFFTNIRNVVMSFFAVAASLLRTVFVALWQITLESLDLLGKILHLFLYVLGFAD